MSIYSRKTKERELNVNILSISLLIKSHVIKPFPFGKRSKAARVREKRDIVIIIDTCLPKKQ